MPLDPKTRTRLRATTPLLVVANLQRSIDFYVEQLGFVDPNVHGEPPCFAMLNRDGFDLMLSLAQSRDQVRPNGPSGVWDIYLSVANIADEIASLTAAGVALDKGPTDTFYQMREIEVIDPDGYRLCLAQDIGGEPLRDCETMSGVLDIGSAKLRLVFRLKSVQGKLIGSLDSLDQNAYNLPLDVVTRDGATLRFEMKQLLASFEGKYSQDETTLTGHWSQRGHSWPLVFSRS